MPFIFEDPAQVNNEVHVGDLGTQFITTIYNQDGDVQDISAATDMSISFYSPSRITKTFPASFYTNGVDGKIVYTLSQGDIDESGGWKFQITITFVDGKWNTNIRNFIVYPNIPPEVIVPP